MGTAVNDTDLLSSRLVNVLPTLRRWGFRLTQLPQAARQPYAHQRERSLIAACYLLGVPAVPENFNQEAVTGLALVLLDNTGMSLEIPEASDAGVRDGSADHHRPPHLLTTGAGDGRAGGLAGPL